MSGEDSVVSTLEQQQEEFRHIQSLSQRFLQVLLATLAITLVFARQEWIDFFLQSEVPQTGLGMTCPSGASISGLSPTMVLNNGQILQALVVIGLACIGLAGVWAARILFIDSPTFVPEQGRQQVPDNDSKLKNANQLLREAHGIVAFGIGLLVLAGIGYWTFYLMGDLYIVAFDVLVLGITLYLIWHYTPVPTSPTVKRLIRGRIVSGGLLINVAVIILVGLYLRFVLLSVLNVMRIWAILLFYFCPNSLL